MLADLRQALRALAHAPTLALVAVVTLGLGLGAAAVVLTVAHAVLLRPLPFPEPERLVRVWPETSLPKQSLVFLREHTSSYRGIAGYWPWSAVSVTGGGEPESLPAAQVTADFFAVLGVPPALGRGFAGGGPGAPEREAVLSDGLWRRRFGADPGVVGRSVVLDGESWRVAGVMPPGFGFPRAEIDVWLPLPLDPADEVDYTSGYLSTVARLAPGVTPAAAQDELDAAIARMRAALGRPDDYGQGVEVVGLQRELTRGVRPLLLALAAAVGFVLLIIAANLAHLLLLRGVDRAGEVATRAALGAGRARLVRMLLAENLLLAALGAGAGIAVASWGLDLVIAALPETTPRLHEVGLGVPGAAAVAAAALAIWLLAGLSPALRVTALDPAAALSAGGPRVAGDRGTRRRTAALVVAEVALALILATGAGLAVNSFWRLSGVDPGFSAERVVAFLPLPPDTVYPEHEQRLAFYRAVEERVAAVPGVEAVGGIHMVPVRNRGFNGGFEVEGRPTAPGASPPNVNWRVVTPGYFATLGIPVVAGRPLDEGDRAGGAEVALVNRALAERFWPGDEAVGQRFTIDLERDTGWITVAGVVGDVRQHGLDRAPLPEVYRPAAQSRRGVGLSFVVRTAGDPAAAMPAIRRAVWDVDPDTPVSRMETLPAILEASTAEARLLMRLLGFFAALALLLGAIGVYGILAHEVQRRTREIGIRVALGARRRQVARLVVRRTLLLVAAGSALGLAALPALGGLLESLLFGVEPADPATVAAVLALLAAVSGLAAWAPARRALRLDPVQALRSE